MDRDEQAKNKMQKIAKEISRELPRGMGFVLLTFDFGDSLSRRLNYVSNGNREDIVKVMKEWISKTENHFGEHIPNDNHWMDFTDLMKQNFSVNQSIWCLKKSDFSDFLTTFGAIKEAQEKGYDWSDYKFVNLQKSSGYSWTSLPN